MLNTEFGPSGIARTGSTVAAVSGARRSRSTASGPSGALLIDEILQ